MSAEWYRLLAFVVGLAAFLAWEYVAPHHGAIVPRLPRWLVNLSFAAMNAAASAGLCATCLYLSAGDRISWRLPLFGWLDAYPLARLVAEVLVLDCVIYWQHRFFHVVPWFWRFHRVHHTDLDLDVTSASRFHIGEIVLSSLLKLAVVVTLSISVTGIAVFEVVLLVAAQFQHSNVAVAGWLNRLLWFVAVPPEMHRIHHCPERRHHDANYGTFLTLWDWLFGTLAWPASHETTFGLSSSRRNQGIWSLLWQPLKR